MKIFKLFTAIIFTLFISSPAIAQDADYMLSREAGPKPGNVISMDFQNTNLKTVLKIFSQQSGLNFIASQGVQDRTVTIYFDSVTVKDALDHIMDANNLVYEQAPGSNIFIVKESIKPPIDMVTKVYELKYALVYSAAVSSGASTESEVVTIVKNILSSQGKVVTDKRSNSLIITDVLDQFLIIEDVISRLDVKAPQVMIEAEIIQTKTTVADKLGINWSGTFGAYSGPSHNTVWPLRGEFSKDSSLGEGLASTGSFSLGSMTATLKAILSDTDSKVLARPRVLTLNNETAEININSNDAIEKETVWETTEFGQRSTTDYTRADKDERPGVSLQVTPLINKDGYIKMTIAPRVITKTLSDLSTTDDIIYDLQFRTAKTTVMLKDGETVVIGGLISKNDDDTFNKIPFLGDIPLLGLAFRYKTADKVDQELLIFITPHIVKDTMYSLGRISE
ncbi:MAG: hypothetical protein KJ952_04250, partial [Candidatus Omnitrophica bacterium]|nr:hypothetical protein [Candidatus Omnitrophota bacterium]